MTSTVTSLIFLRKMNTSFVRYTNLRFRQKSFNSHEWLKRRESDEYVEIAKQQNYRCRSAFKLIEIDNKYKIIQPGFKVLDIGAAPGSWSQVLADRTNANGKDKDIPVGLVIAIDLSTFQEIEGVTAISNSDFTSKDSQKKILEFLGEGEKFDFIFSDMAPAATGVKQFDQQRILNLVYPVILFAIMNLRENGGCLFKVWDGGDIQVLRNEIKRFFKYVNIVKPNASYSNSSEYFILLRNYFGLKTKTI